MEHQTVSSIIIFLYLFEKIYFYICAFNRWCTGEPNNGGSNTSIIEGCGALNDACIKDDLCSAQYSYVCEMNM